jgi:TolA-binding protein
MKRIILKASILIISSLILLGTNCAYYNTFYNAQKYYRDGVEKQKTNPSQAKASFDKAVEKSALEISNYPRSRYTSEALFVIGMSYYYTGEYTKAIAKFENLLLVFPSSKNINEAKLYWALSLIENKEYASALEKLQTLQPEASKSLSKPLQELAVFKTADLSFRQEEYDQTILQLKDFIKRFPRSELYNNALLMLGDAHRANKNYQDAITTYKKYLEKVKDIEVSSQKSDTSNKRFKGVLRLAECLIESNQTSEGIKLLDELFSADTSVAKQTRMDNRTYLELGRLFLEINDLPKARSYLKKIRTAPDIVEAFYLIGNSFESEAKFDTAKAYYDSVVIRRMDNEYTTLAQSRLELLQIVVPPPIPSKTRKDTTQLNKTIGITTQDTLKGHPEIIESDTLHNDSLFLARDTLKHILTDTTQHIVADTLKTQVKQDTISSTDSASVQFHLAEIYNLNLKQYERAITEYEKVFEKYPQSPYAPKSLFAEAWIYKNILRAGADTSHYNLDYKRILSNIITKFPNTEYATEAKDWLQNQP